MLRRNFYRNFIAAILIALVVGGVAFGFFEIVYRSQSMWIGSNEDSKFFNGFPKTKESVCAGCGKMWWIYITGGGGLLLGIFKVLSKYPQGEVQTFFQEIIEMEVHWQDGFLTCIGGFITLCAGASMGPEAPIGAFGGSFGTWLSEVFEQPKPNREIWALCGMAAAMGALFASPVLSVILILEIAV